MTVEPSSSMTVTVPDIIRGVENIFLDSPTHNNHSHTDSHFGDVLEPQNGFIHHESESRGGRMAKPLSQFFSPGLIRSGSATQHATASASRGRVGPAAGFVRQPELAASASVVESYTSSSGSCCDALWKSIMPVQKPIEHFFMEYKIPAGLSLESHPCKCQPSGSLIGFNGAIPACIAQRLNYRSQAHQAQRFEVQPSSRTQRRWQWCSVPSYFGWRTGCCQNFQKSRAFSLET